MMLSPTVYLVDDDAAVARAIASLASLMQLRVLPFASAESFLTLKDEELQHEGCLILDIRLPGMSGLDLLTVLRDRKCELPVIIMSADPQLPERHGVLAARSYLRKPFDLPGLLAAVASVSEL